MFLGILRKKAPDQEKELYVNREEILLLKEITGAITGFVDSGAVIRLILDRLVKLLQLKLPSLYVLNGEGKKLLLRDFRFPKILVNFAEKAMNRSVHDLGYSMEEKENILVQAVKNKKIEKSDKLSSFTYPLLSKDASGYVQGVLRLKTMLAIPLMVKEEAIGAMAVAFDQQVISKHDLDLIQIFANQISIALYNAQLFDKLQGQIKAYDAQAKDLRALFEIVKTTTETLDFGTVGQQVVDSIPSNLKHLGFIGGILTIMNWETRMNKAFAVTNIPLISQAQRMLEKPFLEHEAQVDISESASSRSIRERRLIVTSDFSDLVSQSALPKVTANAMQSLVGMKAGAAVPIIVREKILGSLIFLLDKSIAEITDRDKELMNSFASQVGVGMENARLYVTEKERAAKLNEVNQELVRIDNIKSEFLSIASHQLRTPLSGIKGYLSMLKAGDFGPIPKQQDEVVDIVYENTNRLIQLVSDFLNVSRIEGGRLKVEILKVKLKDIVTNIVKELEPIAEPKHIRLIVTPSSVWPLVKADPTKMTEVFSNLIDNAIKYTPQGYVEISTEIKRPDLIIKIRDTGVGISPEEITQLFQKFSRGKNSNKINTSGSGIGLYVVKNLLKVQNADVWVESAGEGRGSTFFVRVPLV